MTEPRPDLGGSAALEAITVADEAPAWTAAGFALTGRDRVRIGATTIELAGRSGGGRGITGWRLAGLDLAAPAAATSLLDGLPTELVPGPVAAEADPGPAHPNGVVGLDHVVVATPDLERTIAALGEVGLACRRIRDTRAPDGAPLRQAFFRVGASIIEVISGAEGSATTAEEQPATWFGLALDVADLDRTAAFLGPGLGRVKQAVQPGRRIATLRHRDLDLSVTVAAMDDRGGR